MIKINYDELQSVRNQISSLTKESIILTVPLVSSMGKATQTEKEIIELLIQICQTDLPTLFASTDKLLGVISDEFKETENTISNVIINGGLT